MHFKIHCCLLSFLFQLVLQSLSFKDFNSCSEKDKLQFSKISGDYKFDFTNSDFSSFKCKCVLKSDSVYKVDRLSLMQNLFQIRGPAQGVFCSKEFFSQILWESCSPKDSGKAFFFDKKNYDVFFKNNTLFFLDKYKEKCNFILKKIDITTTQYDMTIYSDSLIKLKNFGWDIKYYNNQYDLLKQQKTVVVGATGFFNKGKTWILNALSEKNLPSEYFLHTEGLSLRYKDSKEKTASFLDSVGFDTPLKIHEQEFASFYNNSGEENSKLYFEKYRELLNDRHITQEIIQNFIIDKTDVTLILVGQLTFSEQKFLNKIFDRMKHNNIQKNEFKKLIIVHNYQNIQEKRHIFEKIRVDIKQTFNVTPTNIQTDLKNVHKQVYYDSLNNQIIHVIIAQNNSEAGYYFNPSSISFIKSQIMSQIAYKQFDLVQELQNYMNSQLSDYFNCTNMSENEKCIPQIILKNRNQYELIPNNTKIKIVNLDTLGSIIIPDNNYSISVNYDLVINESRNLISLIIEMPGYSSLDQIKMKYQIINTNQGQCLKFFAKKTIDENDEINEDGVSVIEKKRQFGNIIVNPQCIDYKYKIKTHQNYEELENGILSIHYPYEDNDENDDDLNIEF